MHISHEQINKKDERFEGPDDRQDKIAKSKQRKEDKNNEFSFIDPEQCLPAKEKEEPDPIDRKHKKIGALDRNAQPLQVGSGPEAVAATYPGNKMMGEIE